MVILVLWSGSALMAQQYHYYYQNEPNPLALNTEYAYLRLDGIDTPAELQTLIGDAEVTRFDQYHVRQTLDEVPGDPVDDLGKSWAEIRFHTPQATRSYFTALERIAKHPGVTHTAPYFSKGPSEKVGLSDLFVVKLHPMGDPGQLFDMARKHHVQVIGQNRFMPEWYTVSLTRKSKGNALEMANLFYESGIFAASEPDLMVDESLCVNDPLFGTQWGMDHTGQWGGAPGLDVNACAAWNNWTTGDADIIIAVLDHGYEQNHPDLMANNFGTGFDTESGTAPALVLGSHGTACAGIVGAVQNNSLGVTGMAPNCRIMSISNSLVGTPNSRQRRADGLNWAWQNGADVISNSWGSGVQYQIIDDAITSAIEDGRGGLGTVVCFATGNDNLSSVAYPANTHNDIVAVGAMSPCGERKNPSSCDGESTWGANYGVQLDFVAPGVKVPTTDRQGINGYTSTDFNTTFNGTSSACPHAAGLAGLILSMNPCLSQRQVGDIMEQTSRKVGGYSYATTTGRTNGTWNNEMGYGLIDAEAALRLTRERYVQNTTITTNEIVQVHGTIFAGNNVDPSAPAGDVFINSGANVDFVATTAILLEPGFNVNLGATFDAVTKDDTCSNWNPWLRQAAPTEAAAQAPQEAQVRDLSAAIHTAANTFSIAPNPFDHDLDLRINLQDAAQVAASMYNLQGQEVAQLLPPTHLPEGAHSRAIVPKAQLPPGIYFVRLRIDQETFVRKMIKH